MNYSLLQQQLCALVKDIPYFIANLANASALLYESLPDINWAGFYLLVGERLILGPFQGKPACIEIGPGRGVCGACVQQGETIRVADVHSFPGHIACDGASRSEIVIPLFREGKIAAVLDIDSPLPGRFSSQDQAGLEAFAHTLEELVFARWNGPEACLRMDR